MPPAPASVSNAANQRGSIVRLPQGAEITLDALLYCTLMASGNDAAVVIAEFISGSESNMVQQMNRIASELGMNNTKFNDCTGVQSFDNRSTTRDLTTLALEILRIFPQITEYTTYQNMTIRYTLGNDEVELNIHNTNQLLGSMQGVYGLKTGTAQTSHNVIVLMRKDNRDLMVIILDAPDSFARWRAAKTLLEFGISR